MVTVNDYLAQRDAENNRPLFEFLGMSVGINLRVCLRQPNVKLTLPTSLTALTTNTVLTTCATTWRSAEERVQRKLHYALVDEVDSILIDEARTPLIISGPAEDSSKCTKSEQNHSAPDSSGERRF